MKKEDYIGLSRIQLARELEKELNYKRYLHSMGVAFTATALAMRYDEDVRKTEVAGMLHDRAKCLSDRALLSLCKKNQVPISEVEYDNPSLLHAKAGAVMAEQNYGVTDPDILNAIRSHTTGRPGMSTLEKIIFIADYIEPGRNEAPNLDKIRQTAFEDLDKTLLMILGDTLDYLHRKKAGIDPMTQKTFDYYSNPGGKGIEI